MTDSSDNIEEKKTEAGSTVERSTSNGRLRSAKIIHTNM